MPYAGRMFQPAAFRVDDQAELLAFMTQHPFATLVTVAEAGAPYATHLPLLVQPEGGKIFIRSHLARANKQWQHFATGEALAIFSGPHALIHSNWYESSPNVPTWNYTAVHAYGTARVVEGEMTRRIAYGLVEALTPDMHAIPEDFERRLLAGVVTFELEVSRLEGKYKLSQNKSAADQGQVISHLEASARQEERETAAYMARVKKEG